MLVKPISGHFSSHNYDSISLSAFATADFLLNFMYLQKDVVLPSLFPVLCDVDIILD